jgi:hypothetical protein
LVDAVVNRTELAMPPAVNIEMAKGFTLYMVKAVMSGRGDELMDLARTNLWRSTPGLAEDAPLALPDKRKHPPLPFTREIAYSAVTEDMIRLP